VTAQDTSHEAVVHVSFLLADVLEPRMLVAKGQSVEYCLATNKATGELKARAVTVLPTEGIVERVLESHGYLKADEPCPARMDREVRFEMSDVEKGDLGKMEKGNDVQFFFYLKAGAKDASAIKVKRVHRDKTPKEKMPERMRRQTEVVKVVIKMAAGPDGTRGFVSAGRGKGLVAPAPGSPLPSLNVEAAEFTFGSTPPNAGAFEDATE